MHNAADIAANPLPWSGLNKSIKYFKEIGPIVYVINCSANFFAYQCLVYKEKKLQKERKQEREMERTKPTSPTQSTGVEWHLSIELILFDSVSYWFTGAKIWSGI